jgi:hypothetical protein
MLTDLKSTNIKGLSEYYDIEFVEDNPILDELGGVGGLLRFKRTTPQ